MNAVNLAQQLVAIGRKVQQVEQQLRQPVVALESYTQWEALLVDPAVRLSALIAPHIHLPTTPHPLALRRLPAAERFDFQPIPPHHASGSTKLSPHDWAKDASRHSPRAAAEMDRILDPASPLNVLGTAGTEHAPRPATVGGVRLTRDRASLLSLLQAAVQSTGAQPSSPGFARQPASPAVTLEPGDGAASNRLLASPGMPPVDWGVPGTTDNSSLSPTLAWDENRGGAGRTSAEPERQTFDDFPAHIRRDELPPSMGDVGSDRGWSGIDRSHAASAPLAQPVRDGTRRSAAPIPDVATEHSGFDVGPGVVPAALQEAMIWNDSTRATVPLSALQIDQILDALGDRMELLLLRAYGVAP